jgi:predicted GNAT family acetyltransferase
MTVVSDNAPARRFEMSEAGQIVFADYRRDGGRLIIDHVEAPPALRGRGAAGRFMTALAALARARGERIVPLCSYAAAWFARHPEHRDLVG